MRSHSQNSSDVTVESHAAAAAADDDDDDDWMLMRYERCDEFMSAGKSVVINLSDNIDANGKELRVWERKRDRSVIYKILQRVRECLFQK